MQLPQFTHQTNQYFKSFEVVQQEIFEKVEILHSELQEIKEQITQKEHRGIDIATLCSRLLNSILEAKDVIRA